MTGKVVDLRCLNCEKRIGGVVVKLSDGEVTIEFPMCKACNEEILRSGGPMDNETAKRLLERLKERGIIDEYVWDVDGGGEKPVA